MARVHKPEGNETGCPHCGGLLSQRITSEMYAGAFISDNGRVEIRKVPNEQFRNPIVLDPITQYFDGGLFRLRPTDPYYSRGSFLLHRTVWAVAFGTVPPGCHIHHRDRNPANNCIENLECLPAVEHSGLSRAS